MTMASAGGAPATGQRADPDERARSRAAGHAQARRPPLPAAWDEIDATLEASFPASDPPSWTLGRRVPARP